LTEREKIEKFDVLGENFQIQTQTRNGSDIGSFWKKQFFQRFSDEAIIQIYMKGVRP